MDNLNHKFVLTAMILDGVVKDWHLCCAAE